MEYAHPLLSKSFIAKKMCIDTQPNAYIYNVRIIVFILQYQKVQNNNQIVWK